MDDVRVDLVRLAAGQREEDCEQALRTAVPALAGSLLTWLHDDWYALAPDVRPQLLLANREPVASLHAAGAVGTMTVSPAQYAAILATRAARGDEPGAQRADIELDPPRYPWPAQYQGQPFDADWHLGAAGILDAWEQLAPGGAAAIAAVKVGHIDTGYTPHPALGWGTPAGTWVRAAEGRNYWRDKTQRPDFGEPGAAVLGGVPEYPDARDNLSGSFGGHGTRTSSTIAGLFVPAQDARQAFFGAAPGAAIVPYRITDHVLIDHVPDLLAAAIRDALARGCGVINISLGALRSSRKVAAAVDAAYERGVIVCAAAGNVLRDVVAPGRFHRVLTVGGATTDDGRAMRPWSGASRGPEVDVSAPSDPIRRATTVIKRGSERYLVKAPGDGTSFGTALCSGIAALWLARRGADLQTAYGGEPWARVAAFKHLAAATATVPPGWDRANYGAGVIHAGRLLMADLPPRGELQREPEAFVR